MEVALRIHEADADERHAKVAGFFAVIAGQHAEAARVDRQRLMQREFSGEVGDRLATQVGAFALAPGVVRGSCSVEARDAAVVIGQPLVIGNRVCQRVRWDLLQHAHRVVGRLAPQRVIEVSEDAPRVGVPTPPEVVGEFFEPFDSIG